MRHRKASRVTLSRTRSGTNEIGENSRLNGAYRNASRATNENEKNGFVDFLLSLSRLKIENQNEFANFSIRLKNSTTEIH